MLRGLKNIALVEEQGKIYGNNIVRTLEAISNPNKLIKLLGLCRKTKKLTFLGFDS